MSVPVSPVDEDRSQDLVAQLDPLVGSPCAGCGSALNGRDLVFSWVVGAKSAPRCRTCLASAADQSADVLHERVLEFARQRACYRAAWRWADGTDLPPPSPAPDAAGVASAPPAWHEEWDAGALDCGDLTLALRARLARLLPGRVLRVVATSLGAAEDVPAWCKVTGNALIASEPPIYLIRRKE